MEQRDPKTQNSLFIPILPHRTTPILHQPQISQNFVNFTILGLFLNGIPVSRPPFFGERPYPRQSHPVGKPLILARFHHLPDTSYAHTMPAYHNHHLTPAKVYHICHIQYYIHPSRSPIYRLYIPQIYHVSHILYNMVLTNSIIQYHI